MMSLLWSLCHLRNRSEGDSDLLDLIRLMFLAATTIWKLSEKKRGEKGIFLVSVLHTHSYLASSCSPQWTCETAASFPFYLLTLQREIHAKFNMPALPPAQRLTDLSSLHQSEGISPAGAWVGGWVWGVTGGSVRPSNRNVFSGFLSAPQKLPRGQNLTAFLPCLWHHDLSPVCSTWTPKEKKTLCWHLTERSRNWKHGT